MRLGVFIDGDNISNAYAGEIRKKAYDLAHPMVARVYGNAMTVLKGWEPHGWLRPVYAGGGKNATDIVLGLDAIDFAYARDLQIILIVSSDGDFYHLATKARELGCKVVGVGMPNAPKRYRDACSEFHALSAAAERAQVDDILRRIIEEGSQKGAGVPLKFLGSKMGQSHGVSIKTMPEKTWRAYIAERPDRFAIHQQDGEDYVRFIRSGFEDDAE